MNDTTSTKKGKLISLVVGAIAFAISFFGIQQLLKKDFAEELKKAAIEVNKQVPMQVDPYTRLDSASAKGKTNFIYYYTLIDLDKTEVNLDTVNKYVRPTIIEGVKTSPDLKVFRDNNIIMDYKYYDKKGVFVTEISVTPAMYN